MLDDVVDVDLVVVVFLALDSDFFIFFSPALPTSSVVFLFTKSKNKRNFHKIEKIEKKIKNKHFLVNFKEFFSASIESFSSTKLYSLFFCK